jgi:serine/threonine protein kinase
MNHDRFRLTGTTIAHKYAVLAMVEEGGFSVIYRARHLVWDRHVAIKAFKAPQDLSEDQREALVRGFVREGAILAELSERSTAICQSRDIGTLTLESGEWVPYLVLEWLDGECLEFQIHRERERKQPPRSLGAAMVLLAPIAGALALAHRRGISHRDVKPGNLFVLHDGGMKLLDFGIASEASVATPAARRPTRADLRSFTPQYGAPEQFSLGYGPTGSWTDVFALALILIELMTGREPLEGATTDDLASAAMNLRARRPPPPRRPPSARGASASAARAGSSLRWRDRRSWHPPAARAPS